MIVNDGSHRGVFGRKERSAASHLNEFDLLLGVDGEAGAGNAETSGGAIAEAQEVAVERARFVEIGGLQTHVIDAGDFWAQFWKSPVERRGSEESRKDEEEAIHFAMSRLCHE